MSQWELVLAYIKAHGSITSLQAVTDLGIIDLQGRIRDLRKKGFRIIATEETGKNRYGEKCRYNRYSFNGM